MTHTTAIVLTCVFAALALIAAVFVKKRTLRIVLTLVCAIAALLCLLCIRQTAQDDEIKKEALGRVSDDIEFATDIIENTKFSGSQVTYPYERKQDESYSKLTDAQKKLYDEILPKVQRIEDFTYSAEEYGYSTLDDLLVVMGALNEDHPELELYFLISEVIDGDTTTALQSHYFMPSGGDVKTKEQKDELRHELAVFDAECDAIVAGMPEGLSAYDQYRYLAVMIALRTTYDYGMDGGVQIGTAYGAIEGGLSICQGYSRGFEYLCKKADLWCETVVGLSRNVSHAWNLVRLESGTYHVDVTWSDGSDIPPDGLDWFDYFMLTQDEILIDHDIDNGTVATGTHIDPPI